MEWGVRFSTSGVGHVNDCHLSMQEKKTQSQSSLPIKMMTGPDLWSWNVTDACSSLIPCSALFGMFTVLVRHLNGWIHSGLMLFYNRAWELRVYRLPRVGDQQPSTIVVSSRRRKRERSEAPRDLCTHYTIFYIVICCAKRYNWCNPAWRNQWRHAYTTPYLTHRSPLPREQVSVRPAAASHLDDPSSVRIYWTRSRDVCSPCQVKFNTNVLIPRTSHDVEIENNLSTHAQ